MTLSSRIRKGSLESARGIVSLGFRSLLSISSSTANMVYEALPHKARSYLCSHRVFVPTKRPFKWAIALANGARLRMIVDPADKYSVGLAFRYKCHDVGLRRAQEFFIDRSTPGTVWMDIGASIGVSSLYALSKGMTCWLFEPNASLQTFVQRLFAHNQFDKYRWESIALAARPASGSVFYVSETSFLSSFDRCHAAQDGNNVEEIVVPVRTLDSFLTEIRGCATDLLIKIDVEGHESQVLEGARAMLAQFWPPVFVELLRGAIKNRSDTWEFFSQIGYQCFGIVDSPNLCVERISSPAELQRFEEINFIFMPGDHRLLDEFSRHS